MQNLMALRENFSGDGILICFNGPFTHSIIEEIGNAVKRYLEGETGGHGSVIDVFAVYIEQTQNVRNYIARQKIQDQGRNAAIVVISSTDSAYIVCSGNVIRKEDVGALAAHIEEINGQDKDGLKRMYKETLRRERKSEDLGAGLGLIDMARRSKRKLEYSFKEMDDSYSFFTLEVAVARGIES